MNTLEKAAEILVECGHAVGCSTWSSDEEGEYLVINIIRPDYSGYQRIELLNSDETANLNNLDEGARSIEIFKRLCAREQADAIEDWLGSFNAFDCSVSDLWDRSKIAVYPTKSKNINACYAQHQWRLDRIKWCLEELVKL